MSSEELGPKEWLRCNNCYILMRQCKVPFFLSFCSHIFCTKCVKIAVKKCPQCQAQNLRTMPLVEPLSPEVRHCFEPIEDLNEQMQQATTFQSQQWAISNQRFLNVEKKYTSVKEQYQRIHKAFKISQQQCQEVANELNSLQKKIYNYEQSEKNKRYIHHSSAILTPQSLTESAHSLRSSSHSDANNQPLPKRKSYHNSILTQLTPTKLEQMDLNSEFRIPTTTKVPRSVGSSSRNSSNSSVGTPSTIYSRYVRK
ncbi:zip homologous protein 2-like [Leptopilina heterotoma]|uniref:zip homologous protein 2-like n=1 Tax=Leptopilina heterotoma TaxID=63436 RepID=UPI001CA823AB|nr:zip homologous protein 2-like [Leptopilina heterotoma]